jgi:hypothetical protein
VSRARRLRKQAARIDADLARVARRVAAVQAKADRYRTGDNVPHPICDRCGREIQPGQNVEFVGMTPEQLAEARIVTDPMVMVHADPKQCHPTQPKEAA